MVVRVAARVFSWVVSFSGVLSSPFGGVVGGQLLSRLLLLSPRDLPPGAPARLARARTVRHAQRLGGPTRKRMVKRMIAAGGAEPGGQPERGGGASSSGVPWCRPALPAPPVLHPWGLCCALFRSGFAIPATRTSRKPCTHEQGRKGSLAHGEHELATGEQMGRPLPGPDPARRPEGVPRAQPSAGRHTAERSASTVSTTV